MYAKEIDKPEHDAFIYADVSTFFLEMNYADYFLHIDDNRLTGFQLTDGLNRGIIASTNPSLYQYIPLHPYLKDDVELKKTNVILVKKTEYTRKLLKWYVDIFKAKHKS
uniref:Uncharacterized protein n=1 Tax=Ditylenchus dipsaci TaxID=166011 RepID=A0A915EDA4_9BILA